MDVPLAVTLGLVPSGRLKELAKMLLAVGHCRSKVELDGMVITGFTPTSLPHQYWCVSKAGGPKSY